MLQTGTVTTSLGRALHISADLPRAIEGGPSMIGRSGARTECSPCLPTQVFHSGLQIPPAKQLELAVADSVCCNPHIGNVAAAHWLPKGATLERNAEMLEASAFLGILDEPDVEWLVANSKRQDIPSGSILIRLGKPVEFLFLIVEGASST